MLFLQLTSDSAAPWKLSITHKIVLLLPSPLPMKFATLSSQSHVLYQFAYIFATLQFLSNTPQANVLLVQNINNSTLNDDHVDISAKINIFPSSRYLHGTLCLSPDHLVIFISLIHHPLQVQFVS